MRKVLHAQAAAHDEVECSLDHGFGVRPRHQYRVTDPQRQGQNSLSPRMRAIGSRCSRRAASAETAFNFARFEQPAGLRDQSGAIQPQRVTEQDAGVGLRRFDAAAPKDCPIIRRVSRDGCTILQARNDAHGLGGALGCQQFGLMLGDQRINEFVQRFPLHHLRQFVERQVDAVIGDAALRIIIGADAFRAVAGTDLPAPVGGTLGIELAGLLVVELGA